MDDLAATAFRRHYRQVFRFVRRHSASPEDAEDVTAEVFASAIAGLHERRSGAPPVLAWLYTVARRRLADEARRRARAERLHVAAVPSEYGPDVARALAQSLRRLPEAQRRVVAMKLIEGRTFREIADRLGTTEGACKMRLARGLERLRDELEKEGVEP